MLCGAARSHEERSLRCVVAQAAQRGLKRNRATTPVGMTALLFGDEFDGGALRGYEGIVSVVVGDGAAEND